MSSKSHIMKGFLKQDTESTITVDRSNSIEVKVVFSIEKQDKTMNYITGEDISFEYKSVVGILQF